MNSEELLRWLVSRINRFPESADSKVVELELPRPWTWEWYMSANGCQWEIHLEGLDGTQVITPRAFIAYKNQCHKEQKDA